MLQQNDPVPALAGALLSCVFPNKGWMDGSLARGMTSPGCTETEMFRGKCGTLSKHSRVSGLISLFLPTLLLPALSNLHCQEAK